MKKTLFAAAAFFQMQLLSAQPDASFTFTPDSACTPDSVTFTNTSTNMPPGATYTWSWGDFSSYNGFDTSHTYWSSGAKAVTLNAYDQFGGWLDDYSAVVFIRNGHNGNFNISKNPACPNEPVNFDPSGNNFIQWDFGDGFTSSMSWETHSYSSEGNYNVMCIVSTDCGNDTIIKAVTISNSALPNVLFNISPNNQCPNTPVNFYPNDYSGSHYWSFSDGFDTNAASFPRTFDTAGNYTVVHMVTNICGNSDSDSAVVVIVDTIFPDAAFTLGPNPQCPNKNINFSPMFWDGNHFWELGDGFTSSSSSIGHSFSDTGFFSAIHTVTNGCNNQSKDTQYVSISDTILCVNFSVSEDTGCIPFYVAFTNTSSNYPPGSYFVWDFADGSPNDTNFNSAHTYNPWSGTFWVGLNLYDSTNSNIGFAQRIVFASWGHNGNFNINPDTACPGQQVNFNANGNSFIQWNFGDSTTSFIEWETHTYNDTGVYNVMCIVNTACGPDTIIKIVTITTNTSPDAQFNINPNPACPDRFIGFSPQDYSGTHNWSFSDGYDTNITSFYRLFDTLGNYTVIHTITDVCGGSNSDTAIVFIVDTIYPDAGFSFYPSPTCPNSLIYFDPDWDEFTHFWSFSDGYTSTSPTVYHSFDTAGAYTAIHTITNTCNRQSSDTQFVSIVDSILCVSFSMNPGSGCAPLDVAFTNSSSNFPPGSYFVWNFNDGSPYDTSFNAVHTFNNWWSVWVYLTLYDSSGFFIDDYSRQVQISWGHNGNFNISPNPACPGQQVNFDPNGNNFIQWNFGDSTTSTNPWEWHTYNDTGIYNVMCIVNTGCGPDTIIKILTISTGTSPNAQFSIDPNPSCPNSLVNFDPQLPDGAHNWLFSDGMDTNITYLMRSFIAIGAYSVIHTITDACGGSNSDTAVVNIVDTITPVASFTVSNNLTCPGNNINCWPNQWDGSHYWEFSDGFTAFSASTNHAFSDTGYYSVIHRITNSCNVQNSDTQYISVVDTLTCVSFIVNKDTGCTPFDAVFTNTSSNYPPGSYFSWNYGDGSPSDTGFNATHTYYWTGWFYPELKLFDSAGYNLGNSTRQIIVNSGSNGNFNISKLTACPGEVLNFDPNGNNLFQWNFGDGFTSTNYNDTHSYNTTGTYNVLCILNTSCGLDTLSKTVTVSDSAMPDPQFNFSPNYVCPGTFISFSPYDWSGSHTWSFSDGLDTNTASYSKSFAAAGVYTVIHTITNSCGNSDSDTAYVNIINSLYPDAAFNFSPGSACPNSNINFWPNQWDGSHYWDFGDGYNSSFSSPGHSFAAIGTYTVIHTITNGCNNQDSDTAIVSIVDTLQCISFIMSGDTGCTPFSVVFTNTTSGNPPDSYFVWNFNDGSPYDTSFNSAHTFNNSGWYTVYLNMYDTFGNYLGNSSKQVIVNWGHNGDFNISKTSICPGEQITFDPNGNNFIQWNFGDGFTSTQWWTTHTYSGTGIYNVLCIVNTSCGPDTITKTVTVSAGAIPPVQAVVNQNTVCPGDVLYFDTQDDFASYLWNFGDATTSNIADPTHAYSVTGNYQVILTVTNDCGNSNNDTLQISVQNNVPADASFNYGCCNPACPYSIIEFNGNASGFFNWSYGDGIFDTGSNVQHFYTDTGYYMLQLIHTNSCGNSDSAFMGVTVQYNPTNKPNASFEFEGYGWPSPDTITVCTGEEVEFRDNSWANNNGPLTYIWLFGDGDSSLIRNPNHIYFTSGFYAVQLIAENSCQGKDTAVKWVIADPAASPNSALMLMPDPSFSVCPGTGFSFIDDVIKEEYSGYSYSVWFGDGDSAVNINSVAIPNSPVLAIHYYDSAGIYNYLFISTNSCGISDSLAGTINVVDSNQSLPFFAEHFDNGGGQGYDSTFCPGDTVTFLALGGTTYLWQFPGASTSTGFLVSHAFDSMGVWPVSVIITNGCGVSDTLYDTIIVSNTQVPGSWFDVNDNFACGGDTLFFDAGGWFGNAPVVHFWDFGDGTTSSLENPAHAYSAGGVYSVTHTVTNGCGTGNPEERSIIVDVPVVDFSGLGLSYCLNASPVNLNGNPGGGIFSGSGISGSFFDPPAAGTGIHNITYSYTNSNGCPGSNTHITTVSPLPPADAGTDRFMCSGDTFQLNGTGGVYYSWSPSSGLSDTMIPDPIASPSASTPYYLTVTDSQGCSATDTVFITVASSLTADAGPDVDLCEGDSVMLNGSGGGAYSWYPSGGLSNTTIANPYASPSATTVYYMAVSSASCSDTDSVVVTFFTPLSVNITASDSVIRCPGNTVNLTSSSAAGYLWSTGNTSSSITVGVSGAYSVTITDANGCNNTATLFIPAVPPMITALNVTNSTCVGVCNGSIDAGVSGGAPPYTYQWDDPLSQTTSFISGLCIGTYHLTVTDDNGCVMTDSATISQPPPLAATNSVNNVSCYDSCNGSATLSVTGGLPPYNFTWSSGATSATATGLCADTFGVTITDLKGCLLTSSVIITKPSKIATNVTSAGITCNGGTCDGTASVSASGGTPGYSYLWSTGDSTLSMPNLCTGVYYVAVFDGNNCNVIDSAIISEPTAITATAAATAASCNGVCDGMATANPGGGTPPYFFAWSTGATIDTASGLCPGTYTVTVTDAKGCSKIDSTSVTEPATLTAVVSVTNINCNGDCNGIAQVIPAGGTPSYNYLWSNVSTDNPQTGLCPGTYYVTVIDANGCTDTASGTITEPPAWLASVSGTDNTCSGGNSGSADVTVTNGSGTFQYSWSNGAVTEDISGVTAGTYSCTVVDVTCSDTIILSVTITEPSALSLIPGSQNASCGVNDGSAWVTVTGGTPGYSYLWNDSLGQTNDTALSFYAGLYCVTVTDGNSCTVTACIGVNNIGAPVISLDTVMNVSCNSGNDGEIYITATGAGTLTYNWNNGESTDDLQGVSAGTYVVSVTDSVGCIVVNSFDVYEPLPIAISFTYSDVSCYSLCNGFASSSVSGGTPPYQYLWNTNDTSGSVMGLCAGDYLITVTDDNSCTGIDSITVTEPSQLAITTGSGNATCGNGDGFAFVNASGGIPPYYYQWNDSLAQSTDTAVGLYAGTYSVIVADTNNCTVTGTAMVINTGASVVTVDSVFNVTCNSDSDGAVYITASGAGTLSYNWSDNSVNEDATGLSGGTYFVSVTDSAGCIAVVSASINEPVLLTATATATAAFCFNDSSASASAFASGGTPPYSYLWSNGDVDSLAAAVGSGSYTVTVTDANGCTSISSSTVTEPAAIVTSSASVSPSCNGDSTGSIDLTVSGGTGSYSFNWSDGSNNEDRNNIGAGSYSVTITDGNNCTASDSMSVTEPAVLSASISSIDVTCYSACDGNVWAVMSGGTPPYSPVWSTGCTSSGCTNLCVGWCGFNLVDNNGCTFLDSIYINEPALLTATATATSTSCYGICDGSVTATASGGIIPYTYLGTGSGFCQGNYPVTVTDANGCIASDSTLVTEPAMLVIDSLTMTKASCQSCPDGTASMFVSGGTGTLSYTWSNGEITSTITGLASDTFFVTVNDANGCIATGSVFVDFLVTQSEISIPMAIGTQSAIFIYPNPAKDVLYLNFEGNGVSVYEIRLVNIFGQEILTVKVPSGKTMPLYVGDLAEGMYRMVVMTGNEISGVNVMIEK
ncbi:MAG: PKD domain-containing protein [Bacteroidetes bacterium]|nr:PKD domain-containing protein [Bacteroidota bacterium]